MGAIIGIYIVGALAAAAWVWSDAEFRPIDRMAMALFALIAWPLALPYYLLTRPESVVQDLTYEKSHKHYKDYVKTKSRDIGEGVEESLKQREAEAQDLEVRKSARQAAEIRGEFEEDNIREVGQVVIGGEDAGWKLPGEKLDRKTVAPDGGGKKSAPRTSYGGGASGGGDSLRSKIYGDGGAAPAPIEPEVSGWNLGEVETATPVPRPAPSGRKKIEPPPDSTGWNLTPQPSGPRPTTIQPSLSRETLRSKIYGDAEDLPIPGVEAPSPIVVDKNVERLINEGQLREAHQAAKRMLEIAARLGDLPKQEAYQRYLRQIEMQIQVDPPQLIDD